MTECRKYIAARPAFGRTFDRLRFFFMGTVAGALLGCVLALI